jgi:hypothetical protein
MGELAIRLAHEQGLLSRPSLNVIQQWALHYWFSMSRRIYIEDADRALEAHVSMMWPERWQQLFGGSKAGDMGQAFGGEAETPVTDAADLDRWFEGLANEHGMTGAEAQAAFSVLGWAEPGTGVKV